MLDRTPHCRTLRLSCDGLPASTLAVPRGVQLADAGLGLGPLGGGILPGVLLGHGLAEGLHREKRRLCAHVTSQDCVVHYGNMSHALDDTLKAQVVGPEVVEGHGAVGELLEGRLHRGSDGVDPAPFHCRDLWADEVHERVLCAFQTPDAEDKAEQPKHDDIFVLLSTISHLIHRPATAANQRQVFCIWPNQHPIPAPAVSHRPQCVTAAFERVQAPAMIPSPTELLGLALGSPGLRLLMRGRVAERILAAKTAPQGFFRPLLRPSPLALLRGPMLRGQLGVVLFGDPCGAELRNVVDDEELGHSTKHVLRSDFSYAPQFDAGVEIVTRLAVA
mmetsp:Transcript_63925/g.207792  ORF Transcript_63925/g.207792 Transcript_63925/m.207792 type:complete len:333 (+) Transcript_63925:341-1339(+)